MQEYEVIEITIKDCFDTEFVMLARNEDDASIIKEDIESENSVYIRNVLIMKNGEVTGYVEDAHIMLAFLNPSTLTLRKCKDDKPKFAL